MAAIPAPKSQGLHSSTFTQPPLDGSLSLPALYDWQGIHSPHHPLFIFEEAPGCQRTIPWNEALQGIQRATKLIREKVGYVVDRHTSEDPPVVAVLASADSISFATFNIGALRTGCILFPLSLRNSVAATAALLKQTGAAHLFVSSDKTTRQLAEAAIRDVASEITVEMHAMPVFEELYPVKRVDATFAAEPLTDVDMSKTALILHSSGTTAFPKPIYITHRSLIESSSFICFGETDVAGSIFACHALPMFHGFGMQVVIYAVSSGLIAAVFKPQSPPVVPNPVNTLDGAIASLCDYVLIPPTFIETWSQDRTMVRALARMKGVIYGGAPLTKSAGDTLAANGVNIFVLFGSTQTHVVNKFLHKPAGMDWEYFEMSTAREVHFIDNGNNEFELVALATEWYRPSVINTKVNGHDAYATSDLFSPHPTKSGFWKVVGRTDDQIMHSTGEKTNPGPLEGMLMRDPFVSGAVVFGRRRFQCGVLVEPKEPFKFDPTDTKKITEFRGLIWPTIETINAFAPQHSRIFKEMILVASPSKPFTYTAKGSLRRQAIMNDYEAEIDALYAAVNESSQEDIETPSGWGVSEAKDFVRQVVGKTMKKDDRVIPDDTDLFEMGLDSLQETWIRNSILRVIRKTRLSVARQMPLTFVYDNPTISRLAKYISASMSSGSSFPVHDVGSKRRELHAIVDKYTAEFTVTYRKQENAGNVVLLTGGTGSLGSNILAKLVENSAVIRVYAMSRPSLSDLSAKDRHLKAFAREGLDSKLLDDARVRFLDGDAESADFGIDRVLYEEMRSSVTHIIHNAWRVNFNVAVASFETNIRSVRNLVDFALEAQRLKPARLLFISSIGVFQNYSENRLAPEEHLVRPESAMGMGYTESKWVSEQILRRASENTPLSATVIRCGQMTGGPGGAWNDHEWFPSLIKSSIVLGKLPDCDGHVSWITGYDAAAAIIDMLDAQRDVLHLVHPKPTPWSIIMEAFTRELKLPAVPYTEWLAALEESYVALQTMSSDAAKVESILRDNPALRLVDFFRAVQERAKSPFVEPLGIAKLDNAKAVEASPALRGARPIDAGHVDRWVSYWKRTGFIP